LEKIKEIPVPPQKFVNAVPATIDFPGDIRIGMIGIE
jgi:hypothetical protein